MKVEKPEGYHEGLNGSSYAKGVNGAVRKTGWEETFLNTFRNTLVLRPALEAAGITYPTFAKRVKEDPEFAECFDAARRDAVAILESAAISRAVNGVKRTKPHFYKGHKIEGGDEVVVEYSDRLLELLLKANDPRYRETVDHNHTVQMMRNEAEKIAKENGWNPDELIAEAERIAYGRE